MNERMELRDQRVELRVIQGYFWVGVRLGFNKGIFNISLVEF